MTATEPLEIPPGHVARMGTIDGTPWSRPGVCNYATVPSGAWSPDAVRPCREPATHLLEATTGGTHQRAEACERHAEWAAATIDGVSIAATVPSPAERPNVYQLFIEELDALTITTNVPSVIAVVGALTSAVKRAQFVHDGELERVAERAPRA